MAFRDSISDAAAVVAVGCLLVLPKRRNKNFAAMRKTQQQISPIQTWPSQAISPAFTARTRGAASVQPDLLARHPNSEGDKMKKRLLLLAAVANLAIAGPLLAECAEAASCVSEEYACSGELINEIFLMGIALNVPGISFLPMIQCHYNLCLYGFEGEDGRNWTAYYMDFECGF